MRCRLVPHPCLAALALLSGCAAIEEAAERLLDHRPARVRYEESLVAAGLGQTALVRDWMAAGERALAYAPSVALPHVEEGYLPPGEPAALAFRVMVHRGQELRFEVSLAADTGTALFLDAWQVDSTDAGPTLRRLASADSGERALVLEPRRDGEVVFRAQPELLRGGRMSVRLEARPTLAFPVEGGRERDIGSRFGAPRDGGERSHHGIDIFVPRGTPALAGADAVVRRVDETPRGGRVVWLRDHRGNALYYAHLDRQYVTEGMRVAAGDTVGFVGNTGNARTTPPHLHFGIYRRGEGPVDPIWFVRRPSGRPARLAADTTLLGVLARTPRDNVTLRPSPDPRAAVLEELDRHTPMRVIGAVGEWFRVRLPDGRGGFVASRLLEPVRQPVAMASVDTVHRILAQPVDPAGPGEVLALLAPGDSVGVLGRFSGYLLVRTPAGAAGWLAR